MSREAIMLCERYQMESCWWCEIETRLCCSYVTQHNVVYKSHSHDLIYLLWWFEWEMSHTGSCIGLLGPWLVARFGEVLQPSWGKCVTGSMLWEFRASSSFLSASCVWVEMWALSFRLWLPTAMPLWDHKPINSVSCFWSWYFIPAMEKLPNKHEPEFPFF